MQRGRNLLGGGTWSTLEGDKVFASYLSNRVSHWIRSRFLNELVQFPMASILTSSMSTNSWERTCQFISRFIPTPDIYGRGYLLFYRTGNSSSHPLLWTLLVSVPCLASLARVLFLLSKIFEPYCYRVCWTLVLSISIKKGKRWCLLFLVSGKELFMLSFIMK